MGDDERGGEGQPETPWFEDYAEEDEGFEIDEYDLTSTPSDFNLATIFNFIESGTVKIPGFQRNFVWDLGRSSKLIESLILGLPVPQLFLYEESRNRFLVIDGQQRLMSIYYFMKERFPRRERRVELRAVFDKEGNIPDRILNDDEFFTEFRLKLLRHDQDRLSRFHGLTYSTLDEYKTQFELRPMRMVIVKQNVPKDDNSSVYEIFNRLNTGGMNLRPQEIRTSMYHSPFYEMLVRMNTNQVWRTLIGMPGPDLHMKDVEILLRAFAFLIDGAGYAPSMVRFLNEFSRKSRLHTPEQNQLLELILLAFLERARSLPPTIFINPTSRHLSIALFEAVFAAACKSALASRTDDVVELKAERIRQLQNDPSFVGASQFKTADTANVKTRLRLAERILLEDA